jgi:HlyD family secretion protein
METLGKKITFGLALILLIAFSACKKKVEKVVVEKVGKHSIVETVSAIGKIYPEVEVKISSDVSGEIIDIFINEGDSVHKGQLLAKINPDLYESGLDQAKAGYQNAKSQRSSSAASLARIKGALTLAEQTYERQKVLYGQNVISKAELESAENNLTAAKSEYKSFQESLVAQQYTVKSAGARVDEAVKNYNRTVIYAPMDGVISSKNSFKGERVVGTSQMAGTEMLRIADMSRMEVRVDVNENDIVRVKIGDTANVEVDAYDGQIFKGVVTEIANSAKSLSGGLTMSTNDVANFVVKISILPSSYDHLISPRRPFPFRPGMSATVDIITARKPLTISIPSGAVGLRNLADSNKSEKRGMTKETEEQETDVANQQEVVFVNVNGKAEQRVVKTGLQDTEFVEILSGLKEGEEVVVYPYIAISKTLEDGTKIEITTKDKVFTK